MNVKSRIFSPTHFIRIFIIVNITAYITTRAFLNKYKSNHTHTPTMPKKPATENTKKAAGNAKKAETAARKQAEVDAKNAAVEDAQWSVGAKDNSKKEAAAAKKAEQAAKKAERDAMLAEEEKSQKDKPKGAGKKTAEKKSRGTLDLGMLDGDGDAGGAKKGASALNASGIDNALDALDLTADSNEVKLDRHPERRFKAAYAKFEERRLPEIEAENPGLRKNQRVEIARKEFERSPENPFNQTGNVKYDSSKADLEEQRQRIRSGVEERLAR